MHYDPYIIIFHQLHEWCIDIILVHDHLTHNFNMHDRLMHNLKTIINLFFWYLQWLAFILLRKVHFIYVNKYTHMYIQYIHTYTYMFNLCSCHVLSLPRSYLVQLSLYLAQWCNGNCILVFVLFVGPSFIIGINTITYVKILASLAIISDLEPRVS